MAPDGRFTCVVHGGAGNIKKPEDDAGEWEESRHKGLKNALLKAEEILRKDGAALDAVMAAVSILEDDPQFNAGKGAVFAADETISLDASIMDGKSGMAGGITNVRTVKNPIRAAREILDHSPHVFLSGEYADNFAKSRKLEIVPNSYFHTEERLKALHKLQKSQKNLDDGLGTVGAVARDTHGNLAAATSTGGLTNKYPGRVSDSSVIGAGTFAQNKLCAVSGTGNGEVFLRRVAAFRVAARMEYTHISLDEAVKEALADLESAGGSGGLIGVDPGGHPVLHFRGAGMYRGYVTDREPAQTAIF